MADEFDKKKKKKNFLILSTDRGRKENTLKGLKTNRNTPLITWLAWCCDHAVELRAKMMHAREDEWKEEVELVRDNENVW